VLDENVCYDPNASYNTGITRKRIVDSLDREYTEYMLSPDSEVLQLDDTGYTDCFGFTCGHPATTVSFGESGEWENPGVSENSLDSGVFCAPDVLYGIAEGGTIDDLFSASSVSKKTPVFSGAIPAHMTRYLSNNTTLNGVFYNLNIWPILFGSVEDQAEGVTRTYYYFVPSNFTQRANLSRSFNFKLLIPEKRETKRNQLGVVYYERPHYFIFLNDSLPVTLSSLDNALPNASDINREWAGNEYEEGSLYSIMGTPVYTNDTLSGFVAGIDYEKYYNLKFDNIVMAGLAAIMSGDFIKGGGNIIWNKKNNLANSMNFAIILGVTGLSTNATLYLPKFNNNFIGAVANSIISISSVYNWSEIESTIDETGKPDGYYSIIFV